MCGITGFWSRGAGGETADERVRAMSEALRHRGPDAEGHWGDDEAGIRLGHRRLAILGLGPAGAQPMHSRCDRYVVVYNGEIYNHRELRVSLEASGEDIRWRGESDTETLLALLSRHGVRATLPLLNGMFALAVWDRELRVLSLVRDRLGEKPLYYGVFGDTLLFGSELKSLREHPAFVSEVDRGALETFLRTASVPAPGCINRHVLKLQAAHLVEIREPTRPGVPERWWSLEARGDAREAPTDAAVRDAYVDELERRLEDAVCSRMIADVPLGAFLSGGYDSSAVVAMMQRAGGGQVRTFAIGFDDPALDEAPYARAVAERLGTAHTELRVTADDALDVIPSLPAIWDEPFGDPSQIPTWLVSRMTREHVTVSLSGDGGDELFGGYTRYAKALDISARSATRPAWLRRLGGLAAEPLAALAITPLALGGRVGTALAGEAARLSRRGYLAAQPDPARLYDKLVASADREGRRAVLGVPRRERDDDGAGDADLLDPIRVMTRHDMLGYLPETILTKVDRASMSVSLEARAPLLDHRLVEFAWSVPSELKLRDGTGKWLLREVVHRHLPPELMRRPKRGFGMPLAAWLRGPLRDWAESLLEPARLRREGYLDAAYVQALWRAHVGGHQGHQRILWNVLMFQAWLEKWG